MGLEIGSSDVPFSSPYRITVRSYLLLVDTTLLNGCGANNSNSNYQIKSIEN
jgi:hypothetical protein